MKALVGNLATFASFDVVKLRERLAKIDDPDVKQAMVVFTVLADGVRFFLITCIFAMFLV